MKYFLLVFMAVLTATFSTNAQVVATSCEYQNFTGAYIAENWDVFGEVEFYGISEIELTGTIVDIYGGGGGGDLPGDEEMIVASAEVMIIHQGTLFFDNSWPFFAPDCLERHVFINGTAVSPQVFEAGGYSVSPGDILYFEVVYYPYEMECGAGSWNFEINQFRIVGDCEQFQVPGCTYPEAVNYNPSATVDDGTCVFEELGFPGCTYPAALNYNPSATVDDGTCVFEEVELCAPNPDLDGDGIVGISDLLLFLAVFGTAVE